MSQHVHAWVRSHYGVYVAKEVCFLRCEGCSRRGFQYLHSRVVYLIPDMDA